MNHLVTHAESVSAGHPDKIADAISDSIVDLYLIRDPHARCAIETVVSSNQAHLFGEVNSNFSPSEETISKVVRDTIAGIGYKDNLVEGFNSDVVITNLIHTQSPELSANASKVLAGDQGTMYGSATNETDSLLPLAQVVASELMNTYDNFVKKGNPYLKPDAKSQVVVDYSSGAPKVSHITLAMSHIKDCTRDKLQEIAQSMIRLVLLEQKHAFDDYTLTINGTGSFVHCGPNTDVGLTGRKIIVDQVAGFPAGGGAFSGKDSTKVDRTGAYFARFLAKHLVAAKIADAATVSISYTIGQENPDSVEVRLYNNQTGFSNKEIASFLKQLVSFKPRDIIERFSLRDPIFSINCNYSHYRNQDAPWELIDEKLLQTIKQIIK